MQVTVPPYLLEKHYIPTFFLPMGFCVGTLFGPYERDVQGLTVKQRVKMWKYARSPTVFRTGNGSRVRSASRHSTWYTGWVDVCFSRDQSITHSRLAAAAQPPPPHTHTSTWLLVSLYTKKLQNVHIYVSYKKTQREREHMRLPY